MMRPSPSSFSLICLFICLLVHLLACCATVTAIPRVELVTDGTSAAYSIFVNSRLWFHSGDIWFKAFNQTFSTADGSLVFDSNGTDTGTDIGMYTSQSISWRAVGTGIPINLRFTTIIKQYTSLFAVDDNLDLGIVRALLFENYWSSAVTNCSFNGNSTDSLINSFPSFSSDSAGELGFLSYGTTFLNYRIGQVNGSMRLEASGIESGPLVFFNRRDNASAIIAPFNRFMASSVILSGPTGNRQLQFGLMGGINAVPSGFFQQFLMYFDDDGVAETVIHWGDILLMNYDKKRSDMYNEFTTQYIG